MKQTTRVATTLLACAFALPALAQDNYVTFSGVYTDDDRNRRVDDSFGGVEISVGRFLNDYFALEGRAGTHSLDGTDDLRLVELGLNARWVFARDNNVSPYLLLGIGTLDADSDLLGDDSSSFTTYGGGLDFKFTDSRWSGKAEYRFRESDHFGLDMGDQVFALGLNYAFGKEKELPPPPPPVDGDADGDGVRDSRDQCPNTPAGYRVDSNGCALDSDGDGVVDALDECPNTYRGAEVDAKGCEMDDDQDGIVNRLDECPDSAPGAIVDNRGCEIEDDVIDLEGVNFETNSDRLVDATSAILDDAAATLRRYPDLMVEVAGHTDSQGDASYNEGLSERRANTVRDYLIRSGINGDNLSVRGYGENEPVADNSTAEGRAANRRVELRIQR